MMSFRPDPRIVLPPIPQPLLLHHQPPPPPLPPPPPAYLHHHQYPYSYQHYQLPPPHLPPPELSAQIYLQQQQQQQQPPAASPVVPAPASARTPARTPAQKPATSVTPAPAFAQPKRQQSHHHVQQLPPQQAQQPHLPQAQYVQAPGQPQVQSPTQVQAQHQTQRPPQPQPQPQQYLQPQAPKPDPNPYFEQFYPFQLGKCPLFSPDPQVDPLRNYYNYTNYMFERNYYNEWYIGNLTSAVRELEGKLSAAEAEIARLNGRGPEVATTTVGGSIDGKSETGTQTTVATSVENQQPVIIAPKLMPQPTFITQSNKRKPVDEPAAESTFKIQKRTSGFFENESEEKEQSSASEDFQDLDVNEIDTPSKPPRPSKASAKMTTRAKRVSHIKKTTGKASTSTKKTTRAKKTPSKRPTSSKKDTTTAAAKKPKDDSKPIRGRTSRSRRGVEEVGAESEIHAATRQNRRLRVSKA